MLSHRAISRSIPQPSRPRSRESTPVAIVRDPGPSNIVDACGDGRRIARAILEREGLAAPQTRPDRRNRARSCPISSAAGPTASRGSRFRAPPPPTAALSMRSSATLDHDAAAAEAGALSRLRSSVQHLRRRLPEPGHRDLLSRPPRPRSFVPVPRCGSDRPRWRSWPTSATSAATAPPSARRWAARGATNRESTSTAATSRPKTTTRSCC